MLRLCQRVRSSLNRLVAGSSTVREYAAVAWPTDVSIPDGMTPFDPKGSFGQVDKYTQGLPEDDALVQFVRKLRDLRLAVDKLEAEKKAVRVCAPHARHKSASVDLAHPCSTSSHTQLFALQAGPSLPRGLMTLSDGSVDRSYYTDSLGIHPDFVTGLQTIMTGVFFQRIATSDRSRPPHMIVIPAEEAAKQPTPKVDNTWEHMWKTMAPGVTEAQQKVLTELDEVRKQERCAPVPFNGLQRFLLYNCYGAACRTPSSCRQLADLEERLDEITVDEMLELYPQLAQEIKDEIEAGDYSKTDAGHKVAIDA